MRRLSLAVAILGITILPALAEGQVSLTEVLDQLRNGRGHVTARRLLTDAARSSTELDAFADSLVALALADLRSPAGPTGVGRSVVSVLGAASHGYNGRRPYGGSVERLVTIYQQAPELRTRVLSRLTRMDLPRGWLLSFLEEAVLDTSGLAAIGFLGDLGPPGMAALKRIYQERLSDVQNDLARRQLLNVASNERWGGGAALVSFLEEMVVSGGLAGRGAIDRLVDVGPLGMAALKRIYEGRLSEVKVDLVRSRLLDVARQEGWDGGG